MPDEVIYPEVPENTDFQFPGDPTATPGQAPKPIVLDPNQTYQFGNITQSGQDLVRSLVAPQNPELESLKSTVQQLTQQIQQLTTQSSPQPPPQEPTTRLSQWVSTRFGENPSQLDSLTPQDFIQGLMALSQDTQAMVQGLTQAVPQQVQGIINQQTSQYQTVQSKEQALNQAVELFLQNKATARGISVDQIRPDYEYVIRSLKNSGTYLISDNPAQVSQFALDELAAYDRQVSVVAESAETVATAQSNMRARQIRDAANREMQMLRENPRRPITTTPVQTVTPTQGLPTVGGLVDSEQVFQQERRKPVIQRRY